MEIRSDRDTGRLMVLDAWNAGGYVDRRIGVSWPTPNSGGYVVAFGLSDKTTPLGGGREIVQLGEAEAETLTEIYQRIAELAAKWRCASGFAKLSRGFEFHAQGLRRMLHRFGAAIHLFDATRFADFAASVPIIRDLSNRGLLRVKKGGLLWRDMAAFAPSELLSSDRIPPEEAHPAHAAMNHAVLSWTVYPYREKKSQWA